MHFGDDANGPDYPSVATDALAAVARMEGTVNDVLDFRKLDANLFTMALKPVDLGRLLHDVCQDCRAFLAPHVQLEYRVTSTASALMLDARRVHQILTNGLR